LEFIWSKRYWVVAFATIIAIPLLLKAFDRSSGGATAHIYVQPGQAEIQQNYRSTYMPEPSASVQWVISELHSTKFHEYLRNKFGLLEHFGLAGAVEYVESEYQRTILSNLQVNALDVNIVSIKVTDADPQMAADIANSSVDYLTQRSLEIFHTQQDHLIEVNRKILETNQLRILSQKKDLLEVLREVSATRDKTVEKLELESRILGLMTQFEQSNLDLMRSMEIQELSTTLKSQDGPKNVTLSRKAIAEIPRPSLLTGTLLTILIILFSLAISSLIFGLWRYNREWFFNELRSLNRLDA
jgi:hypothetical protein